MDFAKIATSPMVLVAGGAIGLVILMSGKAGATTSSGGNNTQKIAAILAYNTASLGAVTDQARIAAEVGKARINADVTKQVALVDYYKNWNDNASVVENQRQISFSGVTQAMISANTAVIVDQMNNSNRLSIAGIQADVDKAQVNGQVQIAQMQAKAARAASTNSLIGSVIGSVASVVAAPFTGGLSLAGLAGASKVIGTAQASGYQTV